VHGGAGRYTILDIQLHQVFSHYILSTEKYNFAEIYYYAWALSSSALLLKLWIVQGDTGFI